MIREFSKPSKQAKNGASPDGAAFPARALQNCDPSSCSVFEQAERTKLAHEQQAIRKALQTTFWNRKKAAELLGVDYKALLYRMKKLGISEPRGQ